ncbi:ferredoxin Fer [Haloplanus sp. GCM10025708]|uniref:ferredoxin Fer n=1 Tax=Haloferacaceae TaxID=1644056 RepID=UPI0036103DF5
MDSPFDVLRIDPTADEEEIEQAYRRRVLETHPDRGGSTSEFQLVRTAYEDVVSGRYGDPDAGGNGVEEPPERTDPKVEYLNYEALDDFGWSLDDDDLFEKASAADLDAEDYGRFLVEPNETLLQAAENRGFKWPYACRGGACANCAVAICGGEMSMPGDHILPAELTDRGIRLSCGGTPTTEELQVVYNVKSLPNLDELRLPPHPFELAHGRG